MFYKDDCFSINTIFNVHDVNDILDGTTQLMKYEIMIWISKMYEDYFPQDVFMNICICMSLYQQ